MWVKYAKGYFHGNLKIDKTLKTSEYNTFVIVGLGKFQALFIAFCATDNNN